MERMIYLDMNVFRAIKNKEKNYDYLYAKINNLKKLNFNFPYSAAHLEEVAKLDNSNFFLNLIEKISNEYSYRVGDIPTSIAKDDCKLFHKLIRNKFILDKDKEIYSKCLLDRLDILLYQNDLDEELVFKTKIQKEDINKYYGRVIGDLKSTDTAEMAKVNFLGSRNKESQRSNNIPEYFETAESIRKKFKINIKTLSNLSPEQLFKSEKFLKFMKFGCFKTSRFNFDNIPKGLDLLEYHSNKTIIIDEILTSFEVIGYAQEDNNKDKTIRGFMHDITHAIYGSSASFFVTNDKAFSRKLNALFYFLQVPCIILRFDEFIEYDFSSFNDCQSHTLVSNVIHL